MTNGLELFKTGVPESDSSVALETEVDGSW
jgi:hypothetical protein